MQDLSDLSQRKYQRARSPSLTLPYYTCQREGVEQAKPICQSVPGAGIDRAVGELVAETLTALTLEVTFAVYHELQARFEEADRLRHKAVDRAQYEADLARRRRAAQPSGQAVAVPSPARPAPARGRIQIAPACQAALARLRWT
jgi:hypothetical protein